MNQSNKNRNIDYEDKSKSFVNGALILAGAGFIAKLLGILFKIPLASLLDTEAMSYYVSAYSIYTILIVATTAGIPTAVAKIISEKNSKDDIQGIRDTVKITTVFMLLVGIIASLILFLGAEFFSKLIGNPMAKPSLEALSPAVLFVAIVAVFRGYFQGHQKMSPFGWSQVIEQFIRVVTGLALAIALVKISSVYGAAGATFGATAGAIVACIFIITLYILDIKKNKKTVSNHLESKKNILKRMIKIAIPITIGASIAPMMNGVDAILAINRLVAAGFGEYSNDLYGILGGYVMPITNLPIAITSAIQISLVPATSILFNLGRKEDLKNTIQSGIKMAFLVVLPAGAGLYALGPHVFELLFPGTPEVFIIGGSLLRCLCVSFVFLGIFQVSAGVLQGIDRQKSPAINLGIGAIFKVILVYVLVGIPQINIYGSAISSLIAYMISAGLNLKDIKRYTGTHLDWKSLFIKPLAIAVTMGIIVYVSRIVMLASMPGILATLLSVIVGIVVYSIAILYFNILDDDDYNLIPGGSKVKNISMRINRYK